MIDESRTYELDRAHVFHSWSAQAALKPMVVHRAEGSRIWDDSGKEYLDFTSQLVFTNIGHQHPAVVAAIKEQADKLCTIAPATANAARSEAARLIAEIAPDGHDKVFFTNGGADANEHAIRMARMHTGRIKVLSTYRSYHGGTQLAVNVTGEPRRWASDYGNAGTVHFFGPYLYRSAFHATTEEEECARSLAHLEQVIESEGPSSIAALILEAVPGTAGVMIPPAGYMAGVRELCTKHGIVFIADEVMAGFGRTGTWLATDMYEGVVPDLITFAKGVTSGYVPLGGVILSEAIAATFADKVYFGGLTYSGHPLACATAVATIEAMRAEGMVEHAARIGAEIIGPRLAKLAANNDVIGETRGIGAFWAIEFVSDQERRTPLGADGMNAIAGACKERGYLPFVAGNRIHVVPPINISEADLNAGLDMLEDAIGVV
ncbi:MAG: aspartate aminotransferase family protein [Nocardioides sp.]